MVNKFTFLKAFVLTFVVFVTGVLLGFTLDDLRVDSLDESILQANINTESVTATKLYLEDKENYCELSNIFVNSILEDVYVIGKNLVNFKARSISDELKYNSLERRYFIYEVRSLIEIEKINSLCDKNLTSVIYFYKLNDEVSETQGFVLDFFKENLNETFLVFSFNIDYKDEPLLDIIKLDFNVTTAPTVVINRETYEGFLDKETIASIIGYDI